MNELQEINNKIHARLKAENELLKADNAVLQSKWEAQAYMIQKLHKENERLLRKNNSLINRMNIAFEDDEL